MSTTKIEWTDAVWNPVTGCTKVSAGCKNCYAERLAKGRLSHLPEYHKGFTNVVCHEDRLDKPKNWKSPRKIFVNSMSDLFHEDVPFHFINRVFITMFVCKQHTFQILTKRPKRVIEFFSWLTQSYGGVTYTPLPNVWIGVSVEDQSTANERIPLLLQIPAAVRFLSCEPLLGPISIADATKTSMIAKGFSYLKFQEVHWVIVGGESGHNARPMHPDWVRSIRDQCAAAEVEFFFKQWGEFMPFDRPLTSSEIEALPSIFNEKQWVDINGMTYVKIGKNKSGAKLDGLSYKEFPKH